MRWDEFGGLPVSGVPNRSRNIRSDCGRGEFRSGARLGRRRLDRGDDVWAWAQRREMSLQSTAAAFLDTPQTPSYSAALVCRRAFKSSVPLDRTEESCCA